jgi:hypothetical protein
MTAVVVGVVIGAIVVYKIGHMRARAQRAKADLAIARASIPVLRRLYWSLTFRATWRALGIAAFVVGCLVYGAFGPS